MIIFNVLVESKGSVFKFVDETRKNFNTRPGVKLFIDDYRIALTKVDKGELIITGRVVSGLPPFYYFGFLFLAIALIFNAPFWFVPAFVFFFTRALHSSLWYALVFIIGLRKKGYKGRVKIISCSEALGGVLFVSR